MNVTSRTASYPIVPRSSQLDRSSRLSPDDYAATDPLTPLRKSSQGMDLCGKLGNNGKREIVARPAGVTRLILVRAETKGRPLRKVSEGAAKATHSGIIDDS